MTAGGTVVGMTHRAAIRSGLTATPAVATYSAVLVLTTVALAPLDDGGTTRWLLSQSTTLGNLAAEPFRVLVSSAFWLADPFQLVVLAGAIPLLVLAERRLGTRRWLAAFVLGHVGATLLVAAGLLASVTAGLVSAGAVPSVDVGFSYGACAVMAAVIPRLRRGERDLVGTVLALALLVDAGSGQALGTVVGHLSATMLGLGLGLGLAPRVERDASTGRELAQRSAAPVGTHD